MKKLIGSGDLSFSKAVLSDSKYTLEISGQIGLKDGKLVDGIKEQTAQSIENVIKILQEVGWDLSNVTKIRIFLTDMKNYDKMNEAYFAYFVEDCPTRVAVAVKELPLGALVEIDCTAMGDKIE